MSEKQNCVYLVLKKSRLFPEQYPEFVASYTDEEEAYQYAKGRNDFEQWWVDEGLQSTAEEKFYVRHVWL